MNEERNEDSQNIIELKSEKVQSIIGEIPPTLIRWGTTIIATILFLFAIVAYFVPYPETLKINGNVEVKGIPSVKVMLPYEYINRISQGMDVMIICDDENLSFKEKVLSINRKQQNISEKIFFTVTIHLQSKDVDILKDKKITVSFLISDRSFWQHIKKH